MRLGFYYVSACSTMMKTSYTKFLFFFSEHLGELAQVLAVTPAATGPSRLHHYQLGLVLDLGLGF